jgi:hypothetical protein
MVLSLTLAVSPLFCKAQARAVLSKCIVQNLSPADRTELARWVFLSMSEHRVMRQFSNVSAESRENTSRAIGVLFTRLMADVCVNEVQEVAQAGGPPVVPSAVQFLTQIGVQELMTSREVIGSLSSFSRFADKVRIDRASARR